MIRRDPIPGMKHWISCEVCKISMNHLNRRARSMREALKHEVISRNKMYTVDTVYNAEYIGIGRRAFLQHYKVSLSAIS